MAVLMCVYITIFLYNGFVCFLSDQIAFVEKDEHVVSLSKKWGFEMSDIKQLGQ